MPDQQSAHVKQYLEYIFHYIPYLRRRFEGNKKYYFDPEAAEHVVEFIEENLVHIKGSLAGEPLILDDWQRAIFYAAYGFLHVESGLRVHREVWVEIPRKNGKSTMATGFALYGLVGDGERGPEVYCAAAEKEQARAVFDLCKAMVNQSPSLKRYLDTKKDAITDNSNFGLLKVISAEAYSKHGMNISTVVVDEVHVHKKRDLIDVLHTGTGSREQPLEAYITTAGHDRHSIGYIKHEYAKKVIEGILTGDKADSLLAVIYGAELGDDMMDPAVWAKANPGLGKSIRLEYVRGEAELARDDPSYENTFKQLQLNIWTEQAVRWMPMHRFDECRKPFDLAALKGRECYAGLDLASTTDIAAMCLLFPFWGKTAEGFTTLEQCIALMRYWAPLENAKKRENRDKVPYLQWGRDLPHFVLTEGEVIDYDHVRKDINEAGALYNIRDLAIDRWNSSQLATQLKETDGFNVIGYGQGFKDMHQPCKDIMAITLERKLIYDCDVLRWMMSNVSAKRDPAGNEKFDRESPIHKIDGAIALAMATGRCMVRISDGRSVYETRGLRKV